jgi:hypothetical protein
MDYFKPELHSMDPPPIYWGGSCWSGDVASGGCSNGGTAGGNCYSGSTPMSVFQ